MNWDCWRNKVNKVGLYLKGVFMGAADIIPGVSGGSIALITGIYDDLIDAIHSINLEVVKEFFSGKCISAIKKIHWGFILPLLAGILTAIFSMGRLMNYLLEEQTLYTWSVFFGLIVASAFVIGKACKLNPKRFVIMLLGGIMSFSIVGLVPVETPESLWFLFVCGAIAICAMILPGISGAFLLLILGKYHYITELIKNPFGEGNLLVIVVFALGCLVGILSFSRVLKFVLTRWHAATLAFLTGMMVGSLRKIWPYKEVIETKIVDGEMFVLKEKWLLPWQIDGHFLLSFLFILIGMGVILLLDKVSRKKEA